MKRTELNLTGRGSNERRSVPVLLPVIDPSSEAPENLYSTRNQLLWPVAKGLIIVLTVAAELYVLLTIMSPAGVSSRHTERDHLLAAPVPVLDIQGDRLVTATDSFNLAGVRLPKDSTNLSSALEFLRVCTTQGIEMIRLVGPSSWMVRCEPRIWHWCGVDPVAAHYEQYNLNELIVALGYASFEDCTELTEVERARLNAATKIAKRGKKGIWSDEMPDEEHRMSKHGLNISEVLGLDVTIRHLSR